MTVLGRLLSGDRVCVLQTCRFEGLGGHLYGREAVGDAVDGLSGDAPRLDLETARSGLWLNDRIAVIADLIQGHVQRLWVMSDQAVLAPRPSIDVPLDPDMTQAKGGARFDPLDHPELWPDDAARLLKAVSAWPTDQMSRVRPLVRRAASAGTVTFALVRLEGELAHGHQPHAFNAAVVVQGDTVHFRADEADHHASAIHDWTPAFRP